ncbi:hypothetical protein K7X08_034954 [Anisodus acutangulus]|uniref:Uncharacterized protein n=1 Tax=Anisodus acutangulus TaxID=402998 RepID=A0A9Q1R248_9SOLA|nr:hypothetical protein K7X08_034954 [Anisodus acutangulus]
MKTVAPVDALIYMGDTLISSSQIPYYLPISLVVKVPEEFYSMEFVRASVLMFARELMGLVGSCPFLEVTPGTIESVARGLLLFVRQRGGRAPFLPAFLCALGHIVGIEAIFPSTITVNKT